MQCCLCNYLNQATGFAQEQRDQRLIVSWLLQDLPNMKVPACFVLLCVAVAVSATRSKHHAGHGSNTDDTPGKGRRPGQQIGSPDDASTSLSFSNNDRGSQSAGSVLGGAQALHDGQEGRHVYGGQISADQDSTKIGNRNTGSQQPAGPFQNMGINGAVEAASNTGQSADASGSDGRREDLSRAYRKGYRPRRSDEYDSRSIEEGQQNGRRLRRPSPRDADSLSSEERPRYGRRFRSRYGDDDSRSSEEIRPRRGGGRPYYKRRGDDSREDERRRFGQRRSSVFERVDPSG